MSQGFLLVLGSGDQIYRDYALQALTSAARVLLALPALPTWQSRYPCDIVAVDPTDPRAVLDMLDASGVRLAGVTTYNEFCVPAAAAVAEARGLRFVDVATARRCRDKHLMRRAFAAAELPSARSERVATPTEAVAAATRIGFPVVLKPRSLAGSIGVVRADGPAELMTRTKQLLATRDRQFGAITGSLLVEEMLIGDEVSVESLVEYGRVTVVSVTRKRLGEPPFFEEIGHIVAPAETVPDEDRVRETAVRAHAALGIDYGVTHTEMRLTPDGPRLVEIAARAGGDVIPLLVRLATGVDLMTLSACIATATPWSCNPRPVQSAGVRFFYPEQDLRLRRAELEFANGLNEADLYTVAWEAQPGDALRLPPRGYLSRIGFAVAVGQDAADCDATLDRAERGLHIQGEPLTMGRTG